MSFTSSTLDTVNSMLDAINAMRDDLDAMLAESDSVGDEFSCWISHAADHLADASGSLERAARLLRPFADK